MCRRIYVDSSLDELVSHFSFAGREAIDVLGHRFPRYNGFPREVYPIIIRDNSVGMPVFKTAVWDFTQARMKPARRPSSTNVRCEGIDANDRFGPAYRARRCLIPVKGYVDWNGDSGNGKRLQPYAIAMRDNEPFGLAGICEVWRHPSGLDVPTFAIVTCAPNEMIADINDRMPVVLNPKDYERWLSPEPNPSDLMKPFDADAMTMWPITRRVTTLRNAGPDIINRVNLRAT
ncbi:SOS response-associated peptidase [Rhizobium bangladeshense]|uniref:SOS response-associated peptidase n=1 Tax=Rhizobium bangladeshense TaxID=1138189 RepID=UPI001C82C9BD|nr:SOS response-associated peptidase [Rhizobium bangladeshense]MBX4884097.1 SOS response-associated peptidase [Rhizobium bangladeshense]